MGHSLAYEVVMLFLLLGASAFFSLSETGFTSCSASKFYKLRRTTKVKRLLYIFDNKESLLSLILFGNNALNTFASSIAAYIALEYSKNNPAMQEYAMEIAATVMTFMILIFSEISPKTIAIRNPERVVLAIADIYYIMMKVFHPLIWFINGMTRCTLKIFGVHESKQYEIMTAKDTLRSEIEFYHSQGSVFQKDKEMLGGVLDLSELKLHSVITHKKDIDMINFSEISFEEIEARCIESNHTRIPVYEGDPDKIIGILHFRDFFTLKSCNESPSIDDVRGILMKPQYASSETTLLAQLTEFKKTKNHMAIVVDEYGTVLGIVTLEDIVEEIVGDIEDEHDETHDEEIQILEDGAILCGGTVLVRDFFKKTGIDLQTTAGVSTIAGLVIHIAHKIPKISDSYTYGDYNIEITEADSHKVQSVRFTKKPDTESLENE